ncbi:MAG: DUF1800 domain-containing protein [Tateyamaria sp.]|uniref:DUF1800 domain-containing protein n=1 Tax=Tateyamaria sp. TaxID=1929288 RepID=UPI00329E7FBF
MRKFDPILAEIRFGYGLSPRIAAPRNAALVLSGLSAPDDMVARFPTEPFNVFRERMVAAQAANTVRRKSRGTEQAQQARKNRNLINADARRAWMGWIGQTLLRRTYSETPFRERLIAFWADHFTATGKRGVIRRATTPYVDDAIRPFITGRFADLLQAAVMHPVMLDYLDQTKSIGPNSDLAGRRSKKKGSGLNENLAREVLELHTLGVDGPYTQTDVTQLAEMFTGMTFQAKNGYKFRKDFVEPGEETVLGETYPDAYNDRPVRAVLEDLAAHPATARHVAWKLAVHFTTDAPDDTLVDALENAYLAHDGALLPLYETLLDHPSAWAPDLVNFKPPIDFMSSAFRALALESDAIAGVKAGSIRQFITGPLITMGQAWESPGGPDGWSEDDPDWITPQGLAARVTWAMNVPNVFMGTLPDPRGFVDTALGAYADDVVRFAAASAESKPEAIGLVLMSPAFQRR